MYDVGYVYWILVVNITMRKIANVYFHVDHPTTYDQQAKLDWNQLTLTKNQNLNFKTEIQRNPND